MEITLTEKKVLMVLFIAALAGLSLMTASCSDSGKKKSIPVWGTPQDCEPQGSSQSGDSSSDVKCTGEDEFVNCVLDSCDSNFADCLGDSYKDGDWTGGMCEKYMDCVDKCTCDNNSACVGDCATKYMIQDTTCSDCLAKIADCESKCPQPKCQ